MMKKVNSNVTRVLPGAALCMCLLFAGSCSKDHGGGSPESSSKIIIMSNRFDPQIFNYTTGNGYDFIAYGERDEEGVPISIDYIYMTDFKGDTLGRVSYNPAGHISQIMTAQSIIDLDWESETFANVAISSPDGSEVIYTCLDLNRPWTQASIAKRSPALNKRVSSEGILLLQDATHEGLTPVTTNSSEYIDAAIIATIRIPGEPLIVPIPEAEVYAQIYFDNKLSETVKLNPAANGIAYTKIIPFYPTETEFLPAVKNFIRDFFGKSEEQFRNETDMLNAQLSELKFTALTSSLSIEKWRETWREIYRLKDLLDERYEEYQDRFVEKIKTVKNIQIKSYARLGSSIYFADEICEINQDILENQNLNGVLCPFDIYLDGETKIIHTYLEPKAPKAIPGEIYRVYVEMCNITAGTHVEVRVSGTDGFSGLWSRTHYENLTTAIAYADVPVASEAGIRDEITIVLTNTLFSPTKTEKRIRTVFQ
jgi:hypothetical protein